MQVRATLGVVRGLGHVLALYALALVALLVVATTVLSALGVVPWLSLSAGFDGTEHPQAGMVAQIGVATLLCLLVALVPGINRMLALERSHRAFRMTMTDVASAYHAAHAADRKGAFALSSEFDQVRERIDYLRGHPDLRLLEADVLTTAAQMSQQSHRLAVIYSDERVTRAKDFLAQRQKEVEDQRVQIARAREVCREILRWASQVELGEAEVATELERLEEQLQAALPALGFGPDGARTVKAAGPAVGRADNIVTMPTAAPATMAAAE